MTPLLLEAILYLRFNRDLWDEDTVKIAYCKVIKESKEERLQKKLKKMSDQMEDIDEVDYEEVAVDKNAAEDNSDNEF
jgi:Asp-tRNA(Asn)/Glu-tRNA(Gln) amidotransferase C subunit